GSASEPSSRRTANATRAAASRNRMAVKASGGNWPSAHFVTPKLNPQMVTTTSRPATAVVGGWTGGAGGGAEATGADIGEEHSGARFPPCGGAPSRSYIPAHVSGPHPQFLHRRAYRPRQVHPRGSVDRGDGRGPEAADAGATARHDGSRAGARDHHQAQRRPDELPRRGWRGVRAQPDRHAGPRGLHL